MRSGHGPSCTTRELDEPQEPGCVAELPFLGNQNPKFSSPDFCAAAPPARLGTVSSRFLQLSPGVWGQLGSRAPKDTTTSHDGTQDTWCGLGTGSVLDPYSAISSRGHRVPTVYTALWPPCPGPVRSRSPAQGHCGGTSCLPPHCLNLPHRPPHLRLLATSTLFSTGRRSWAGDSDRTGVTPSGDALTCRSAPARTTPSPGSRARGNWARHRQ
jgi:hypothetical protein